MGKRFARERYSASWGTDLNEGIQDHDLVLKYDQWKKGVQAYLASISFVDNYVGELLEELQNSEYADNTIVILWGDHGWHLGDHGLWNKHSNFEQATRSPLIIYDPSIKKQIQVTSPTEFVDIFPTLCEASGLEIPSNLDGVSLLPLVKGEQLSVKPFAVSQYTNSNKTGYSFRTDRYRYTVWIEDKKSTDPIFQTDIFAEELYDYKL